MGQHSVVVRADVCPGQSATRVKSRPMTTVIMALSVYHAAAQVMCAHRSFSASKHASLTKIAQANHVAPLGTVRGVLEFVKTE